MDRTTEYGLRLESLIRSRSIDLVYQLNSSRDGVEYVNEDGNTPLLLAAYLGYDEMVRALLSLGKADFKKINYSGQNALTLATFSGSTKTINLLLSKWSYKDYTETSLVPPLCVAAMKGHLSIVKQFSAFKPGPSEIVTPHGVNALMLAVANGQQHVVKYFLSLKSDDNYLLFRAKNGAGYSACTLIEKFNEKINKGR